MRESEREREREIEGEWQVIIYRVTRLMPPCKLYTYYVCCVHMYMYVVYHCTHIYAVYLNYRLLVHVSYTHTIQGIPDVAITTDFQKSAFRFRTSLFHIVKPYSVHTNDPLALRPTCNNPTLMLRLPCVLLSMLYIDV